ncbi:cellulose-binding protein [Streptomyces sp. NPDC048182]|uniref:cellulose-binding protein n=1 Tax=Streptomyces sp. NPDC048182 TaxID=3365507 RepID=UPI00371F0A30
MSSFAVVRGRGYRPGRVDACAEALSRERDAAWERAARLTVLARDMAEELAELREVVAGLAPQDYAVLGERARELFALGEEQARAVLADAGRSARELALRDEAYAAELREAAEAEAGRVRGEADARAEARLLAARTAADEVRVAARREVRAGRGEALGVLREARRRTALLLADQGRDHAERLAEAECGAAGRGRDLDAQHAERLARAEAEVVVAHQSLADAESADRGLQDEAGARAGEILAAARARADAIARDTERVLHAHGEHWDAVQAETDVVRATLDALTGEVTELTR